MRKRCDVGVCKEEARVDFVRYVDVPGVPNKVRYLCEHHSKGVDFSPEHVIRTGSSDELDRRRAFVNFLYGLKYKK